MRFLYQEFNSCDKDRFIMFIHNFYRVQTIAQFAEVNSEYATAYLILGENE